MNDDLMTTCFSLFCIWYPMRSLCKLLPFKATNMEQACLVWGASSRLLIWSTMWDVTPLTQASQGQDDEVEESLVRIEHQRWFGETDGSQCESLSPTRCGWMIIGAEIAEELNGKSSQFCACKCLCLYIWKVLSEDFAVPCCDHIGMNN